MRKTSKTAQNSPEQSVRLIEQFLDELWLRWQLSNNTMISYRNDLEKIARRLNQSGVDFLSANEDDVAGALFDNQENSKTQARALTTLRRFYDFLNEQNISYPFDIKDIHHPKVARTLPLSIGEHELLQLLNAPDVNTLEGLRDRALLEIFYASGLRVSEVSNLLIHEINFDEGWVNVIGKGNRQRQVPLGEEALFWLTRHWQQNGKRSVSGHVFFGRTGRILSRQAIWNIVKKHALAAGISHTSPHVLRHAFATHMVNHGANLRTVQTLLGHANIATTEIYTHVADQRLTELIRSKHPRSRARKTKPNGVQVALNTTFSSENELK